MDFWHSPNLLDSIAEATISKVFPEEFFADSTNPIKSKEIYADLKDLSSDQLDTILKIAKAFKALNQNSIQWNYSFYKTIIDFLNVHIN